MPHKSTVKFEFSGWKTVTLHTEQEMADALQLSCKDLRKAISIGQISYSAHPLATHNKEYEFSHGSYQENIQKWACLQAGGHHFVWDKFLDDTERKSKYKCSGCPATRYD